ERLLAARRGATRGLDRQAGAGLVTRADDLILLAEAGIDVHRPLTVTPRPPVTGSPPVLVGREAELAALRHLAAAARAAPPPPPDPGGPPVLPGGEAELAALGPLVPAPRAGRPAVVAASGASGRG